MMSRTCQPPSQPACLRHLVLAVALALAGCATTRDAAVGTEGSLQPAPHDTLNAVLWMQRAVEYRAVNQTLYRAATERLDEALRDQTWNALIPEERHEATESLPPAIIFDVDETVLDNSAYQVRLILDGEEFNPESWDAWVREQRAKAVPGAVAFAQAAAKRGITPIYLTNRLESRAAETIANLESLGFPVKDPSVFIGLGTEVEGCVQHASEKDCRRRWVAQRYRVLMQVGDTLGDFVRLQDNSLKERERLFAMYQDWFGSRWWMLATPTYGPWEPAAFGNDWSQPAQQRRARKLQALDATR